MRLNPDCVRDILLYIEENTDSRHQAVSVEDLVRDMAGKYDDNTLYYHISKIDEGGLVDDVSYTGVNIPIDVTSLSWEGHCFLDNIRDNKVWAKVKAFFKSVVSISLPLLSEYAKTVAASFLPKP